MKSNLDQQEHTLPKHEPSEHRGFAHSQDGTAEHAPSQEEAFADETVSDEKTAAGDETSLTPSRNRQEGGTNEFEGRYELDAEPRLTTRRRSLCENPYFPSMYREYWRCGRPRDSDYSSCRDTSTSRLS